MKCECFFFWSLKESTKSMYCLLAVQCVYGVHNSFFPLFSLIHQRNASHSWMLVDFTLKSYLINNNDEWSIVSLIRVKKKKWISKQIENGKKWLKSNFGMFDLKRSMRSYFVSVCMGMCLYVRLYACAFDWQKQMTKMGWNVWRMYIKYFHFIFEFLAHPTQNTSWIMNSITKTNLFHKMSLTSLNNNNLITNHLSALLSF